MERRWHIRAHFRAAHFPPRAPYKGFLFLYILSCPVMSHCHTYVARRLCHTTAIDDDAPCGHMDGERYEGLGALWQIHIAIMCDRWEMHGRDNTERGGRVLGVGEVDGMMVR